VLSSGVFKSKDDVLKHLDNSLYISPNHLENLKATALKHGLDADRVLQETDSSTLMEGLYIKIEEGGEVVDRVKFVRKSFLQCVLQSNSHWLNRPIVPNGLKNE
jgi:hypothetical protein